MDIPQKFGTQIPVALECIRILGAISIFAATKGNADEDGQFGLIVVEEWVPVASVQMSAQFGDCDPEAMATNKYFII